MARRKNSTLDAVLAKVRDEHAFDARTQVLDLDLDTSGDAPSLKGATTRPELVGSVIEQLDGPVEDEVLRLPDEDLGEQAFALVRNAVAPVYREPRLAGGFVSQYVLGHRLDLLQRRAPWWRVRGEDGYVGWVHQGYLRRCDREAALAWERGEEGEAFVSLSGTLLDEADRPVAVAPWGARLVREAGDRFRLPDGRSGRMGPGGEAVPADRLVDRFPTRGESILRTARRWTGTPYIWGGVVSSGADCSGFVQSVYWVHGIALPRDSDMQSRVGEQVEPGDDFENLRPGDLLFFAEHRKRITHVAISTGGPNIIHCSISNGSVAEDDVTGDTRIQKKLRRVFEVARRVLPD